MWSEPTFDGQPMQKGVHLRWSFLAALGFPPGGFWLCRRAAVKGEKRIPPPPTGIELAAPRSSATATQAIANNAVASTTAGGAWEAVMRQPCQSVMVAGCAAPGCDEVIIETFSRNAEGGLTVSNRRAVQVEQGAFRISVEAASIACVRVVGAGSVDECGCGTMQPPTDCGCGTGGVNGCGGNGPGCGQPVWGTINDNGWQCWGVPFTLPVTNAHWPARYFGAPNPATTAPTAVALADLHEARRRLGTLKLEASLTPAKQEAALLQLRASYGKAAGRWLSEHTAKRGAAARVECGCQCAQTQYQRDAAAAAASTRSILRARVGALLRRRSGSGWSRI